MSDLRITLFEKMWQFLVERIFKTAFGRGLHELAIVDMFLRSVVHRWLLIANCQLPTFTDYCRRNRELFNTALSRKGNRATSRR